MNVVSIVVKTIVSTLDVFLATLVLLGRDNSDTAKKATLVFTLMTLAAIWI